ncbi:hypothetical protein BH11ARM2_BH11ARM2_01940 [soil metagenome]
MGQLFTPQGFSPFLAGAVPPPQKVSVAPPRAEGPGAISETGQKLVTNGRVTFNSYDGPMQEITMVTAADEKRLGEYVALT